MDFKKPKTTQQELPLRPVQKRLLIPLVAVFVVLLVGFTVALNALQQYNLNYSSLEELEAALNDFSIVLAEQSGSLSALTTVIARDEKLRQGLRTLDRDSLYVNYQSLFSQLRKKYKITHFYFHRSDRVNLLRVHKPEKYGDLIDRFTTLEAERTRKIATGIELGPLGTFTLRVVVPILENNQLIGYVELGKEIEDILSPIHSRDEIECLVVIDKKFLNLQEWQQGMTMLGREADWLRHNNDVIIYNSLPTCVDLCDRLVGAANYSDNVFNETSSNGKYWHVLIRPLIDASATVVGNFILLHDSSLHKAFFARLITVVALVMLLVLAALFTYLFNILRKTDRSILSQQNSLINSKGKTQKYINAIDDMGLGLLVVDSNFQILESNNTIRSWFGDDQGRPCYQQIFETDSPCKFCQLDEVLKGGKTLHFEVEIADGRSFDIVSTPLDNTDGTSSIMEIFKDITELKCGEIKRLELENQLHQKHKMEAVGLMAGGMAHNFNNNLAIILGNLEMSQIISPADSDHNKYINNAKIAVLRSRDLVKQIQIYSRNKGNEKSPVSLPLIINETINLLRSTLPSTAKLHLIRSCDITINADSSQLQEVLINLCNNAIHAMDEKGDLTISLDVVELKQEDIPAQYPCATGRYAKVSVQDTGSGMTAETQEKIFDPFFTTKGIGEGTGMGLSTVHGIVTQHSGLIKVSSEPGVGTSFDLYFPIIESCEGESDLTVAALPTGTETILFLDDEEMLADIWSKMLREHGYQVTSITDSTKALELYKENPAQFDLVISDQTMPELCGKEVLKEILSIRPEQPTILCTGHTTKINEEEARQFGIKAFCMKPLDLPTLLQTIRQTLDKRGN